MQKQKWPQNSEELPKRGGKYVSLEEQNRRKKEEIQKAANEKRIIQEEAYKRINSKR